MFSRFRAQSQRAAGREVPPGAVGRTLLDDATSDSGRFEQAYAFLRTENRLSGTPPTAPGFGEERLLDGYTQK